MATRNSTRPLGASEATIQTVSVEVKVISINKKQMTLSVFRQLPRKQIINANTFTLLGTPWGKVNYFGLGCLNASQMAYKHLHIIWQEGCLLYKACVSENPYDHSEESATLEEIDSDLESLRLLAFISEGLREMPSVRETTAWFVRHEKNCPEYFTEQGPLGEVRVGKEILLPLLLLWDQTTKKLQDSHPDFFERRQKVMIQMETILENLNTGHAINWNRLEDIREIFESLKKESFTLRSLWKERYAELLALDQLFIAV